MDVNMDIDHHKVKKLREIILDNLANNPSSVGSLSGLPDNIVKLVFNRCVEVGVLKIYESGYVADEKKKKEALDFFVRECGHKLLISMQLSGGMIFIKRHLDQLSMLVTHLMKLDLGSSCLGSYPNFIMRIGELQRLEVLNLRKNCLCNDSIDRLTHNLRTSNTGLVNLKYLNLSVFNSSSQTLKEYQSDIPLVPFLHGSLELVVNVMDNPDLDDKMTGWLSRLKELKYLNLVGTTITIKSCQKLQEQNLVVYEISEFDEIQVTTSGLAKVMVDQYSEIIHRFAEERRNRNASFWPHTAPCIENFFCCHNPTDAYNREHAKFYSHFIFKKV